jgi:hypothetical protein
MSEPAPIPPTTFPGPCTGCGTTPCLALVRADIPPVGWIDFFDRTISRLASGHWTIRQSGHLIGSLAVIMLAGILAGLAAANKLPMLIGQAVHTPWDWAYVAGSGAFASGGYIVRRLYGRRATPPPAHPPPPAGA